MTRHSYEYTRADAEADSAADLKDEIEQSLIDSDPEYAWKRRIVDAVQRKAYGIRLCHASLGITDNTEVQKMLKKVNHLDKWLNDVLEDAIADARDAEAERRDPYGYRGLRQSDFY